MRESLTSDVCAKEMARFLGAMRIKIEQSRTSREDLVGIIHKDFQEVCMSSAAFRITSSYDPCGNPGNYLYGPVGELFGIRLYIDYRFNWAFPSEVCPVAFLTKEEFGTEYIGSLL